MELQNIEIENSKQFDYEITANYEHFFIRCFVDVEIDHVADDQTNEEIEVQGIRTSMVVDNVDFSLLKVYNNEEQKISISPEEMSEAVNDIENAIINLIQE